MTTTSRSLQNTWNTAWQTAPPASCSTLRNLNNAVAWGQTCVFGEEDGDPLPFSINTACMPWVTSNVYPSPSAFYSPATACPDSWTAVATQTSGSEQWVAGETAISCCPDGFDSDGGAGCRPGSSKSWPVVECGEADAEENNLRTYSGGAWPASATPSITALQLRYQASDIGSASATSGAPSSTASSRAGSGGSGNGLSSGAIAAIATVIPLVFIIGALAAFMLWRRRRNHRAAAMQAVSLSNEKTGRPPNSFESTHAYQPVAEARDAHLGAMNSMPTAPARSSVAAGTGPSHRETPEWNAELDASEAERQGLVSTSATPLPASSTREGSDATELGGMARVARKPIAPVEIDSTPIIPEVGDAYIPYRPGGQERS